MWTAFPSSDYYGGSAPCRTRRATVALPAGPRDADRVGRARQGSHVHCVTVGGVGVQLCSGSIAASTPQAFLAATRTGVNHRPGSRLPVRAFGVRCVPAHIRQVGAGSTITEVHPLVHSRYTFPPRSPDPPHLAVLGIVPALSGLLPTLSSTSWIRLPSTSTQPLRRPGDGGLSPPSVHTAPHGARARRGRDPSP